MTVDLSLGTSGIFTFRNGERFFSLVHRETNCDGTSEGDTFRVRYEHGWYAEYNRDGTRVRAGYCIAPDGTTTEIKGTNERDIVEFEPRDLSERPEGMQWGCHP